MKTKRKHMFVFRSICVGLVLATIFPLCLSSCNKTNDSIESSVSSELGDSSVSTPSNITVKDIEIASYPKTNYYPGEIFDITGLVVKAKLSNGKSKNFFDTDFSTWTHKGEPLTEDVNKITFTLPKYDFTFDLDIVVAYPTDMTLSLDKSLIKESYTLNDTIDFTSIVIRIVIGNETKIVSSDDWKLFNGNKEIENKNSVIAKDLGLGEITLTIKYLTGSLNFTIKIIDPTKVITPSFIEAEDCVYYLNDDNIETENKFDHWSVNNRSAAEYYEDTGNLTSASLLSGASGKAVGGLNLDGNGKKNNNVYFKFKVNVPEDGEYSLKMRGQSSTQWPPVDTFAININSEKDSDNNLKFTNAEATLPLGYRLGKYADLKGKKYYSWNNLFWWGINDIGNYNLKKGENEIRVYLPNGISGNIDYFEVVQGKENQDNKPKIISMRTGNIVDLSNNDLHLEKGKKLTDIVNTPALHPVKYTLLYLRTSTGKDVAILESMLEGKIDYEKVGLQKITVVDPISNEEASFNLIIDNMAS